MSDLFRGTTALITGASRGIGAAFADLLAQRGRIVLVARHADTLNPIAERARARGCKSPSSRPTSHVEAPDEIADRAVRDGLTIDHLINNAGLGDAGRFQGPDRRTAAHHRCERAGSDRPAGRFLPGMLQRSRGGLLNVA